MNSFSFKLELASDSLLTAPELEKVQFAALKAAATTVAAIEKAKAAEYQGQAERATRDAHSPAEEEAAETESLAHRIERLEKSVEDFRRKIEAVERTAMRADQTARVQAERTDRLGRMRGVAAADDDG